MCDHLRSQANAKTTVRITSSITGLRRLIVHFETARLRGSVCIALSSTVSRKTIAQHAADVLVETGNPAIMYGDAGLLDMVADRANVSSKGRYMDGHPLNRWAKVLAGLERSELFERSLTQWGGKTMRVYTLREGG